MAQGAARPFGTPQIIATVTAAIAALLLATPLWMSDPGVLPAAGAVGFAIVMWATGAIAQHIAALILFLVTVTMQLAPPEVVFAGFHASATWLVFAGLIITIAAQRSGLAARLVQALVTHLPARYFGMALGIAVAGMLLSYVMPSASGRAVLMAPLALALAERLGFAENTNARFGIVLAAGWGTTIPAFGILPANVVNMAFVGAVESIHGLNFTYFEYIALNYPVLGIFGALIMATLVTLLFGAQPAPQEEKPMGTSWTAAEQRLIIILLGALILWVTDFMHGVSPAWVAMAAALLCVAPLIGVVPSKIFTSDVNYSSWIFVAGVIGVGAIANHTGLGGAIGQLLLDNVPLTPNGGLVTFYEIFAISGAIGLATTFPASPPIVTAFADAVAQGTGWPLEAVLLAQVPSWMIYPLPHEAPPVAIAMALGGVPMRAGLRLLLPYFIIGLVVLLPLQYFWGHMLGVYP